jgi:hypothetical protein
MTVDHKDVSLTSGDFQYGLEDDAMVVVNSVKIPVNVNLMIDTDRYHNIVADLRR